MSQTRIHLITGASGFIGRHLVRTLLARKEQVWIVMRSLDGLSAEERAQKIFGNSHKTQLRVLEGDIMKPHLGIAREILQELIASECTLWHLAADLSFLPSRMSEAVETNQRGTKEVVMFANTYASRLVHMSTAYVCGDTTSVFHESQLALQQSFRNFYEQSKYEAEVLVHQHASVPFIIMRPSIVIGDAYEGKAEGCTFGYYRFAFMLHTFRLWVLNQLRNKTIVSRILRLLGSMQRGNVVHVPWLVVPYPSNGVVDLVSIDYVVNAMLEIIAMPKAWILKTVHLTQRQPIQSLMVMQTAMEDIGISGVRYVRVPPWTFHLLLRIFYICAVPLRKYMKSVYWYIPYVVRPYHFDHAHGDMLGIKQAPPITEDFLHRVNAYAKDHVFTGMHFDKLH